jgi:opacity protein-like surface antigen
MKRISAVLWGVVAAGACLASTMASADNLLGFYAGVGLGESTVRSDEGYGYGRGGYDFNHYYNDDHHFGWKAIAGIRPIPFLGAEVEYIDFGHPGSDGYNYGNYQNYGPDSHPRAIAAFGVGHIPLPLPFLDVYAKAGAARLHTNVNGFDGPNCVGYHGNCVDTAGNVSQSVWDTRFAYGAGVQYRFWGLSVGAEYERISSPYGDPDLFSVRATWTF